MANEDEDTPIRSDEESSNSGSGSEEQTEWLATTRKKRVTAGNRLSSLILQAAAEDDELELLFAEDENDAVFEDVDTDASDVQMDSSDDDDDQGPAAGAEELEGEKELQRQEKAERQAKKRKGNDGIPNVFRKKVKIDPNAPPPRPKKKYERMSWIPSAEDAPTRASARRTTKLSKEQLYAQMLDRERRRLKQLEVMEMAAKRKEAEKPKTMTQEDKLAEAARVEKNNAKSLNRWEEAEKIREEEQRARLAALHNRKLEGPVITWWSGVAEWVGGKLKQVGKAIVIEEKEKKEKKESGRKRKADEMEVTATSMHVATEPTLRATPGTFRSPYPPTAPAVTVTSEGASGSSTVNPNTPSTATPSRLIALPSQTLASISDQNMTGANSTSSPVKVSSENGLPRRGEGPASIKEPMSFVASPCIQNGAATLSSAAPAAGAVTGTSPYAHLAASETASGNGSPLPVLAVSAAVSGPSLAMASSAQNDLSPAPGALEQTAMNGSTPGALGGTSTPTPANFSQPNPGDRQLSCAASLAPPPSFDGSAPILRFYNLPPNLQTVPSQFTFAPVPAPELPPVVEQSTRNCLILENFDELSVKSRDTQCQIILGKKFQKISKPPSAIPCAITAYPAKFRDPSTGLYYYNAYAYKEIQRLKRGDYRWSTLLQAYVGQGQYAARGVPLRFMQK